MRYSVTSYVIADSIREQPLCVWQGENPFCKSVKRGFAQLFRLRSNALNGSTTGDKPVRPLAPFSLFVVGGKVFEPLNFVLLLRKLPLTFSFSACSFSISFSCMILPS